MKNRIMIAAVLACFVGVSAHAAGPCKDKREAMHGNKKALKECNKTWMESMRGPASDPSDDCSGKQNAFISSVKEMKACMKEAKASKDAKKTGDEE